MIGATIIKYEMRGDESEAVGLVIGGGGEAEGRARVIGTCS